jgi:hypothetical protein
VPVGVECKPLSSITLDRVFQGTDPPKVGENRHLKLTRKSLWRVDAVEDSLSVETPGLDHVRRAVDVNRPVTHWCPCAVLAGRLRAVTGGSTSPARLDRCSGRPSVPVGVECKPLSSITLDRVFQGTDPPKVGENRHLKLTRKSLWRVDAVEDSLSVETPGLDHVRRAVDVNRPVTHWCAPAGGAGRAVTGRYRGIDIPRSP